MGHTSLRVARIVVVVVAMSIGAPGVWHAGATASGAVGAAPLELCDTTGTVSWGPTVGVFGTNQLFTISGAGRCDGLGGSLPATFSGSGAMANSGCCYTLPITTPCPAALLRCPAWEFDVSMTIGGHTTSEHWTGAAQPAVSVVDGRGFDPSTASHGLLFSQIFLQNPPSSGHDTAFRLIFERNALGL